MNRAPPRHDTESTPSLVISASIRDDPNGGSHPSPAPPTPYAGRRVMQGSDEAAGFLLAPARFRCGQSRVARQHMTAVVRVQPSNGGWRVEVDGRTFVYSTQGEAEIVGRRLARTEKLEFVLYDMGGVVRDRVSYGGDTSHLPATEL